MRAVVADLVVAELVVLAVVVREAAVVVAVREAAVPSSPRWWEGTPAVGVGSCGRAQLIAPFPRKTPEKGPAFEVIPEASLTAEPRASARRHCRTQGVGVASWPPGTDSS